MSWDQYLVNLKLPVNGINVIEHAAIWGRRPGQIFSWTTVDQCFPVTAEEIKVLAGDRSGFQGSGPSVAGMKCMVLNDHMDDKLSYCLNMKTKQDVNKKSYTVVVGKTEQTFIIVKAVDGANAGTVTDKVYKMAVHLQERGY